MAAGMERHGVLRRKRIINIAHGPRVNMAGLADQFHDRFVICTARIGKTKDWLAEKLPQAFPSLNDVAPRRIAVLDPVRLIIDNYPAGQEEECLAPNHPQKPEWRKRPVLFSKELWIEREDFMEVPSKGYFRLFPGNTVRLRYGFVVKCIGCDRDSAGKVTAVHCEYMPDSKSGTPGSDNYKVKGNIHWVSAQHAYAAEVRLYDRLFAVEAPGAGGSDFIAEINPSSKLVITAQLEAALKGATAEERFQFERHGYFVADRVDSRPDAPVFNRAVTLKDSWSRK